MHADESIFRSTLRSLFKSLAAVVAIFLLILALIFTFSEKSASPTSAFTLEVAEDGEGNKELLPTSSPVILKIDIRGFIGTELLNRDVIASQLIKSQKEKFKNNRVKGILLHIDSPGGTAKDSYEIYRVLQAYKEKYPMPVYAYVEDACTSGAFMIACAADHIASGPVGFIGSVGVISGPFFNFSKLMEKHGIAQVTLTSGKEKDTFNPFRPWQPHEGDEFQDITSSHYEFFVNLVSDARPRIEREKLIEEYGAKIFDPSKAEQLGYIDAGNSSYRQCVKKLAEKAGIDAEQPYQVFTMHKSRNLLSDLAEAKSPLLSGKVRHELHLFPGYPPEWMGQPLYLYHPMLQGMTGE